MKLKGLELLRSMLPGFLGLISDLETLEKRFPEPLERLVEFFKLLYPFWHLLNNDVRENLGFGVTSVIRLKFVALFQFVDSAGPNEYSWNKVVPGHPINDGNIHIGNVCGMLTLPVNTYLKCRNFPKKEFLCDQPVNIYDKACVAALEYINFHMPIIEVIKDLEKALA